MNKKKNEPKVINVTDKELDDIKRNFESNQLSDSQKKIVLAILDAYVWMAQLFSLKKLSMNKLRRIFGFKTEKSKVGDKKCNDDEDNKKLPQGNSGRGKGKGKNGQKDHPGAERVFHKLKDFKKGDLCPNCLIGKLYPVPNGVHIQFKGTAPFQSTVHETEKLRCNACGDYFEANLPEECRQKYHPSLDVSTAVQRYGLGVPFYRTGKWQHDMGMPLPASTQFERVEVLLDSAHPVYLLLLANAADGELMYADDTKNKILYEQKRIRENKEKRIGIYTTGVVSKVGDKQINLFFTGRSYCGENLDRLLSLRKIEEKTILMTDALKLNLPKNFLVLWAKCLTHARRNFWDYREKYPKMIAFILKLLGEIYFNDKKTTNMCPLERLTYHQKYSGPILEKLRRWGIKKIYLKKIEPNEELGEAFRYLFQHFKELTLFLRVPGVPIDNTISERLLKFAILGRKNSYFFKTVFGAYVGDVMMSLVSTCRASGVNAFDYLLKIHTNKDRVKESPELFLPWNYQQSF